MSILSIILVYALGACLSHAHPFAQQSSYFGSSSSSHSLSSANGITVKTSQHSGDSGCYMTLEIKGRGIYKNVETTCESETPSVINLKDSLLVGDYFSDSPGVLIHITDDVCESETFKSRRKSRLETLSDDECEKIKEKVEVLREQQEKKWDDWHKEPLEQAQKQIRNIDQNLFELNNYLFPRRVNW